MGWRLSALRVLEVGSTGRIRCEKRDHKASLELLDGLLAYVGQPESQSQSHSQAADQGQGQGQSQPKDSPHTLIHWVPTDVQISRALNVLFVAVPATTTIADAISKKFKEKQFKQFTQLLGLTTDPITNFKAPM